MIMAQVQEIEAIVMRFIRIYSAVYLRKIALRVLGHYSNMKKLMKRHLLTHVSRQILRGNLQKADHYLPVLWIV